MKSTVILGVLLFSVSTFADAQGSRLLVPNTLEGLAYPAGMLTRGQGGTVLVQLRIDEHGDVERLLDVQATNGLAELESAVRGVVRNWTFRRNTLRDCKVEGGEGVAQIEFAVKEGKPLITARGRPDVEAQVAAFRPKPAGMSILDLVDAGYPARARKLGLGAVVTVVIDVEETTGIPVAARVPSIVFSRPGYADAQADFTEAARSAIMQARFEAGKGRKGEIYQACVTLQYTPTGRGER